MRKPNPQDATLRNIRALKKRVAAMARDHRALKRRVRLLEGRRVS